MSIIGFKSIHLIGPGLIGGSFALAARRVLLGLRVVGASPYASELRLARRRGIIDTGTTRIGDMDPETDLVFIAVPVDALAPVFRKIAGPLRDRHATVTDATSVKRVALALAEAILPEPKRFVGGHPMAGSERSGAEAARADLFDHATVVLTPTRSTNRASLRLVRRLWTAIGARTVRLTAAEHDSDVAQISHLPYVSAVALARVVRARSRRLAAGGFRDTTRIAASSPALWTGILAANRENVIGSIDRLIEELASVRRVLSRGERRTLSRRLADAHHVRSRM